MTFHDRYQGGFLLPRLMKCMTENFVTEEKVVEVEVSSHTPPTTHIHLHAIKAYIT